MEEGNVNKESSLDDARQSAPGENLCCFSQLLSGQKVNVSVNVAVENAANEENSDECTAGLRESANSMLEENVKMRNTIDQMIVTLERWMRRSKEQMTTSEILREKLREADRQKEELQREIEALRAEVKGYQADWLDLRLSCLQAKEEKEQAQKVILKLQEENWALRKSHSGYFISREPHVNSVGGRIPEMLRRGPNDDLAK